MDLNIDLIDYTKTFLWRILITRDWCFKSSEELDLLFLTINHIRIRDHDKPQDVSLSNCLGFIYMWQKLIIRFLHAMNADICKNTYVETAT